MSDDGWVPNQHPEVCLALVFLINIMTRKRIKKKTTKKFIRKTMVNFLTKQRQQNKKKRVVSKKTLITQKSPSGLEGLFEGTHNFCLVLHRTSKKPTSWGNGVDVVFL